MQDDGYFDESVAATYDDHHGNADHETIARTVEVLSEFAGNGTALEFAIGTGRIALPLSERCAVKGIELSRAMVAELRRKETRAPIEVAIGDMSTTRVAGEFSLVFLVFNTIDNLVTQEAQIACFRNAADHLGRGGRFLIETHVPPVQKLPFGETLLAFDHSVDHVGIDHIDIATQTYSSNHIWFEDGAHKRMSVPFRYAWPAEFDLMARLAGLELEHRWGDWRKSPYTRFSTTHVSVWRKP